MKFKFIFSTIIIFSFIVKSSAQCDNDVNTNPDESSNTNAPNSSFINGFNWWEGEQVHNGGYTLSNMYYNSPNDPYGPMGNIQDANQSSYYQYLIKSFEHIEEMNPKNGWELLLVNLGRYPDDVTNVSGNTLEDAPYIVLYHRYKSLIRVFVKHGINEGIINAVDGIKVNLYYNEQYNYSGLLRTGNPIDQSLSQTTSILKQTSVTASNGNPNKFWMSADFTVAYDPCVCRYLSVLRLDFEQFQETELNLIGRAVTTTEPIVSAQGTVVENDFFGSMEYQSYYNQATDEYSSKASKGYVTYRLIGDLYDDYIAKMEAYKIAVDYNKGVDKQLKWVKIAKKFITFSVSAFTGSFSLGDGDDALLQEVFDEFPETDFTTGTDEEKEEKFESWWKRASKAISEGYDFLINENIPKMSENRPDMPTVGLTEMNFSGSMLRTKKINGPRFYTPGSYSEGNPVDVATMYPVYDQPLGVFALLESPKLNIYKGGIPERYTCQDNPDEECDDYTIYGLNSSGDTVSTYTYKMACSNVSKEHYVQMKLAEPLKFSFNESLNVEDYDIEASFKIKSRIQSPNLMPHAFANSNSLYKNTDYLIKNNNQLNANIESFDFDVENDVELALGGSLTMMSTYVPIDNLLNFPIQFSTIDERTYYYRNDPRSELAHDCEDLNIAFKGEYSNDYIQFDNLEIELRLFITVKFEGTNEDGSDRKFQYLKTYLVNPSDINFLPSPEYPYLFVNDGTPQGLPQNLHLISSDFNGSQVEGCKKVGSQYFCRAWNNVTLSGDFSVSSGYEVFVEAGNEVVVIPKSNVPSEMIWQINTNLNFSSPMPPSDHNYVSDFCNDDERYKARSSNMPLFNNDSTTVYEEDARDIFAFNIFPNPTSGSSTVSITLNESAKGELFITDMNGRTLATGFSDQTLRAGQTEHQLPTASLASGIYLVHLFVDGERHVKRLVKQ
jgi:hypothetical protein